MRGTSFDPTPPPGERHGRRAAVAVAVLTVAFIGLAIAKPWAGGTAPGPSPPQSSPAAARSAARSPRGTSTAPPTEAGPASVGPLPEAFTTPAQPSAGVAWSAIRWHLLAGDDPLTLVRSILRWRRGFIAVGWQGGYGGPATTPVWTSTDGTNWRPVPGGTSSTFWPGFLVVGVAETAKGLVALTASGLTDECGRPDCETYTATVFSWTSTDGRTWSPAGFVDLDLPDTNPRAPAFAAGAAGLVVASTTGSHRVATSADGVHWTVQPGSPMGATFQARQVAWADRRFVAVGAVTLGDGREEAATEVSATGTTWSGPSPLPLTSGPRLTLTSGSQGSVATGLIVGARGLIAVGSSLGTPAAARWWQSADGRQWRALPAYPPLGPTACPGEGCGSQPNGVLVGGTERMVALRGGVDGEVWTSSDGVGWVRLPMVGDLPTAQASQAAVLPGGVLAADGTSTWFGEAATRQGPP